MNEEIKSLLVQVRILEEQAQQYTDSRRQALFARAGEIKNEIALRLNRNNHRPAGTPSPETYFAGDWLTDDMRAYFQ
ncbi:hypothetical protein V4Y24_004722 [Escherichia coli]|nr:hypothetical protein [Escherichia coli]EFF1117771.1 hypothetical protein [Escherichia coli]EIH7858007.1 hypothetical protein [Escherichia coli]EIZ5896926.1 hypothetical protein [Escherichia coli]